MDKCLKCHRFKECPIASPKIRSMSPEKIKKWIEKNRPYKPRIKFVPMCKGASLE